MPRWIMRRPTLTPKQRASRRARLAYLDDNTEGAVAAIPNLSPSEVLAVRPKAAMRMIGVGETFFWKAVRNGEIPVIRYSSRLTMVPIAGLHAFLERHATKPAPDDPELPSAAD
jgi:hypothetical protein